MDETIQAISSQTGIDDKILIEKTYYECGSDVVATICKLLDIKTVPRNDACKTTPSVFDTIRNICDEKDTIFQELMQKAKST